MLFTIKPPLLKRRFYFILFLYSQITSIIKKYYKTVANSCKSDIIYIRRDTTMTIHSIDMPIEQRNTGKGNPNAVLTFGVELNNRQKNY